MARKWQEREGTVEAGPNTMTQEEIVEDFRRWGLLRCHCVCVREGACVRVRVCPISWHKPSRSSHLAYLARQGMCMRTPVCW